MDQMKNLIKYKIDIQNGEIFKEEYPIIKGVIGYHQEGNYNMPYNIYHYQDSVNTVSHISEHKINQLQKSYWNKESAYVFCLKDDIKLVQNLFLDYIKERRNDIEQRYQEAVTTYNKENSLLNNIEQQIMDLTNGQEIEEERSDLE